MLRITLHLVVIGLVVNAAILPQANATAEQNSQLLAGRLKADQVCANCHGLNGQATSGGNSAFSPNLSAQSKSYMIAKLNDYRTGKIAHPQMSLVAQMISAQDIENVSLWYSNLKVTIPKIPSQPMPETPTESGTATGLSAIPNQLRRNCSHCHGLDGQAVATSPANTPHLTGQNKAYLIARLEDYRSGKIQHQLMSVLAKELNDTDIKELADWYSAINIEVESLDQF